MAKYELDDMMMPEAESDEVDLGLDEMKLPEEEDPEIAEMISKLEELGYKVEKVEEEAPEEAEASEDMEEIDDL